MPSKVTIFLFWLPLLIGFLVLTRYWLHKPKQTYLQGDCVSGNCIDGYGFFRWNSGEYYIGHWKSSKQHGFGAMFWKNGRSHIGHWWEGILHGEGHMRQLSNNNKWGIWEKNIMVKDLTLEQLNQVVNRADFAQIQVQAMFKDRPALLEMSPILADSTLLQWLYDEFAGKSLGTPIYWQAKADREFQVIPGFRAVHRWPTATHSAAIWLQDSLPSEEMWACLVFELFNICNAPAFEKINRDVEKGICKTEAEYIHRFSALEHQAILKTQDFYKQRWLPLMENKGLKSNSLYWFSTVSPNFDVWINSYTERDGYPWQPYTVFYKQQLQNILKKY